nr:retrovirus-related Pol polyprotein from transposon TNT 1-94 [Tanacetum cinerariifolium]
MKEKGDACIFVGYSTLTRAYRVFNKRTRVIVETVHLNFDELPQMASDHVSFDPAPEYRTVTTSNELDLLFSSMFDELLNGSSQVVSKSSAVTTADAPNQRQQHITPLNTHITPSPTCQVLTHAPTVTSTESMNKAEMVEEYAKVENDEFINIFCTALADLFTKALPEERFKYLVRRLEYQLADLFTKALPVERFQYLFRRLGMRCLTPADLEALANESA